MALLDQLNQDLKSAMKAGEKERVEFLRFLFSHVHNREIEKRGRREDGNLTNKEVQDVLLKEKKRKLESIELFEKGGRGDLAEKEKRELLILSPYLPAAPTRDDIINVVTDLKSSGTVEFSTIMKEAMKRLPGA